MVELAEGTNEELQLDSLPPLHGRKGEFSNIRVESVGKGQVVRKFTLSPMGRSMEDYTALRSIFSEIGYPDRLVPATFAPAALGSQKGICVTQELIEGTTLRQLTLGNDARAGTKAQQRNLASYLRTHPQDLDFLRKFLRFTRKRINAGGPRYPDVVGYSRDQSIWNAINIIYDAKRDMLVYCDVGLAPHPMTEEKLAKRGTAFFQALYKYAPLGITNPEYDKRKHEDSSEFLDDLAKEFGLS